MSEKMTVAAAAAYFIDVLDDYHNNPPESRCYVDAAYQDSIDTLRASLQSQAPEGKPEGVNGAIPAWQEGWKLVPVEPTEEMREALEAVLRDEGWEPDAVGELPKNQCYDAMLAAAPTPPQQQEQSGEAWIPSDTEIRQWIDRHNFGNYVEAARCAILDARSMHALSPATPTATASQEADEDAPFTLDDAIAHANGLEHQVKMLTRQRDGLELIARMVAGALEKAGFKADEVDNPADAIELLHTRLMAATASQESAPGQEAVAEVGLHGALVNSQGILVDIEPGTKLYVTPPTVNAAIAAFKMKAVEICRKEFNHTAAKEILDIPTDTQALEEFGMKVAEEVNQADRDRLRWHGNGTTQQLDALCDTDTDAIVRRVLDEKGE